MRAIKRLCALALVSGLTVLGLGLGVAPAAAEPFEHVHFHDVSSEVVENFCGDLTVRIDSEVDGMFLGIFRGPDGLFYALENIHGAVTWTNLANGETLTATFDNIGKDLSVVDNGDGTITVVFLATGGNKWYGPDGKLLFNDPGQLRFEILVDTAGTPTNPFDDEEISVSVVKGSTGRSDLDGLDFCADIISVIR